MTEVEGLLGEVDEAPAGGRRAAKSRRRGPGCLFAVVILALLFGGLYFGLTKGIDTIRDQFDSAADYPGPGTGKVVFEVHDSNTVAEIGRGLKAEDVVASVEAFLNAANDNPDSNTIQVRVCELQRQMAAEDALEVLVDPENSVNATVTVPEGLRVVDIVALLAKNTDYSRKQYQNALADTAALGLPAYAEGNPEGYLFPATYEFGPEIQSADILRAMVVRWEQAAVENDLEAKAAELGYTPHELMTIASLIEAEGRGDYRNKISRVIYNRLDTEGYPTFGLLQIDATVNYALGRELVAVPTTEETQFDHPYNTYVYPGLPPGPIEAPGDAAIKAATAPAKGPWLFYVTVNLDTGETKFTDDYDEFLQFKGELQEYCETQSDRC